MEMMIKMSGYDEDMELVYCCTRDTRDPIRGRSPEMQAAVSAWWESHPEASRACAAWKRAERRFLEQTQYAALFGCHASQDDRVKLQEAIDAMRPHVDQCRADIVAQLGHDADGMLELHLPATVVAPSGNAGAARVDTLDDSFDGDQFDGD